jgi:hypothetical protein
MKASADTVAEVLVEVDACSLNEVQLWSNELTLEFMQHSTNFEAWILYVWSILVDFEANFFQMRFLWSMWANLKHEDGINEVLTEGLFLHTDFAEVLCWSHSRRVCFHFDFAEVLHGSHCRRVCFHCQIYFFIITCFLRAWIKFWVNWK